jgi:hypothetical protein
VGTLLSYLSNGGDFTFEVTCFGQKASLVRCVKNAAPAPIRQKGKKNKAFSDERETPMRTAQAGFVPGLAHYLQPFDEYPWRLESCRRVFGRGIAALEFAPFKV